MRWMHKSYPTLDTAPVLAPARLDEAEIAALAAELIAAARHRPAEANAALSA